MTVENSFVVLGTEHVVHHGAGLSTRVGGKAEGLVRLASAGVRVPPWAVVLADAFRAHITRSPLAEALAEELAALEASGPDGDAPTRFEAAEKKLRPLVEATPLDAALEAAVRSALAKLGPGPYAVRSSMVGEDSTSHSFAGQFDTYLFQRTEDEVLEAVRRCYASAFTARSLAYRRKHGLSLRDAAMAVVLQRMIDGQVSGVVFTTHPLTGRSDHALVSACWGLGEGLVSGACNADEYTVTDRGDIVSSTIADKDSEARRHEGGRGTTLEPVDDGRRHAPALSPEQLRLLVGEAFAVARRQGRPLDLEWTITDGEVFWLQARPITTTAAAPPNASTEPRPTSTPDADGERIVWDNSNIQESFNGVTTPLTFSFALRAYASVYEQTVRLIGMTDEELAPYRPIFQNLLGLIGGRVYYNINNWYRLLLFGPGFDRTKEDMEKMMGLETPVDFVEDRHLTTRQKLERAPILARAAVALVREFARLDKNITRFQADFEATVAKVDRTSFPQKSLSALLDTAELLRREAVDRWQAPIINDNYVMRSSGALRRILEAADPANASKLWSELVAGEDGIESTEPTRRLMRIAQRARREPNVAEALRAGEPKEALARARAEAPWLDAEIRAYLDRYGDRVMGELKLETLSLRDDPSFLVHVLRNYLEDPNLDPDALSARERTARAVAERHVEARLGVVDRARFRRALAAARKAIKARENMRLSRTRLFGLYRDLYAAVGLRLHEVGRLDEPRDVFYLTVQELEAYRAGTAVTVDLASLARTRKKEFEAYKAQELPNRIETVGPPYHGQSFTTTSVAVGEAEKAARELTGLGCSAGVVEAPLAVVHEPRDAPAVRGAVLTAVRTDPGWAPLFPTAAAVLVERGSTLSHSAILARELGIPAVVGVPNLLKIVKQGERVRLDGSTGKVLRLEVP